MGCGCSAPVTAPDAREENQNLENSLMDADEVCPTPRNLDDDMHATTDTPTVAADEDEEVVGDDHDAYTPEVDEEELYAQAAVMDDEHDHDEAPHGDGCTPSPRGGACAGEDICWGGTCESFIISPTADDRRAGGGTADGDDDDDDDGHPLKRRGGKGVDGDDDDDMHEVLRDASESVVLVGHGPPGEDEEDVDDHGDASSTRGGAGGVGGQRSAGMDAAELPRIRSGSTWSSRSSPQLSRSFTPTPTATPTSHDATTRGLANVDGRGVHGASGAHDDDVGGDGCARSASGSGGNAAAPSKRWTLADQLIFDAMRSLSVNGRKVVPRYTTNEDDDDDDDNVVVRDGARDATSSSSPRLPPIISAHPPTHDARRGCARRRVHPTSILTTQAAQNIDACADPRWLRWCISVAEEYAPVMAMPREWMRQHGAAARAHIALLEELRADPDNTWSTSSPTPLRTAKERARQPHTRNPNRCLHASDIVCYPHIEMANTRGLDFKYAEKLRKHACPRCDATCSDWVKRYFPTPPTAEMVEHEAYVFDAQLEKELCQERLRRVCTPYNHSVVALEQLGSNPSP